ncbi:MAG: tRNA adenosine(34) deaminase TadA [Candidatus Omnitrophota bacterium]
MTARKHEEFMQEALKEAQKAFLEDEVPVGAVIVHENKVIARGHNQVERLKDPTAHAEMIALTSACACLGSKWLNAASLYVTIEPCSMCAGALVLARVKTITYGADDPKTGACGSVTNIVNNKKLNHRISVKKGILKQECGLLLKEFFRKKRNNVRSPNP